MPNAKAQAPAGLETIRGRNPSEASVEIMLTGHLNNPAGQFLMGTWPKGGLRPDFKKHCQYAYFNEFMTGFEYQVRDFSGT